MLRKKKVRNRTLVGKQRRGTTRIVYEQVEPRSPYMGTRLTVDSRREYIKAQEQIFIDNQRAMVEAKKQQILDQEGTEEEIAEELAELEKRTLSEEDLIRLSKDFGKFQANKSNKEYEAYLNHQNFFRYKGKMFPVTTEEFLMKAQNYKDIISAEMPEEEINQEIKEEVNNGFESVETTDGTGRSESEHTTAVSERD